ncbi:nicotinate-nucleotide adenylyltransferase [Thalassospira profundimaris]|uniref:Probable nicotinate-nucleotide adenylyltransferase n=1 Tax=Thalassospira profundimaris TaxID=502049 RepID=A0A367XHK0_9PROT|nr:nicotinate-nucleotide adenylyltransferase [Thalassospira profundimaris]RCK52172.1 nicotinate-nucleotide adenylyltransferase [Thalassospira profundimaris]
MKVRIPRRHNAPPRVGLLGGSFNPAHEGHLHISLEALKRLELDEVWWLVSPQNPLKSHEGMAEQDARFDSAELIAQHPRIVVSAIETQLGTRYTADTLAALQRRFTQTRFVWLMGADNLAQFHRWKFWEKLIHHAPIAVLDREGYSDKALRGTAAKRMERWRIAAEKAGLLADMDTPAWVYLPIRRHPASSTAIRAEGRWQV